MENISLLVALSGGLLSLLSPCVFPLIPVYVAVMAGSAVSGEAKTKRRRVIFFHTLMYVIGFTLVFVLLGAGAGGIGSIISANLILVRKISGGLMILMGVFMLAAHRIRWLNYEKRIHSGASQTGGLVRSFTIGILFALAWTPCVGPILAGVLALAFNTESVWSGAVLLGMYSLGLGLPFLIIGLIFDSLQPVTLRLKRFSRYVYLVGGLLLIAIGILIWFNKLNWIA
jgi:cytochrome c-type biogenesis protein